LTIIDGYATTRTDIAKEVHRERDDDPADDPRRGRERVSLLRSRDMLRLRMLRGQQGGRDIVLLS
jgi:hypothetical protein